MEGLQPRQSSGSFKRKRTFSYKPLYFLSPDDSDDSMTDVVDVQVNSTFSKQSIIYYALVFLKVGLWITLAWILSFLHLGTPCFLLPLILWLYSGPLHRALNWAKRRLWRTVAKNGHQQLL